MHVFLHTEQGNGSDKISRSSVCVCETERVVAM